MVDELAAPGAELAEKGPDFERKVGEAAATRNRPAPVEVERADQDVIIDRPDLGEGAGTFVAKGDPIPPELADRPRRRASAPPDAPARRARK